MRDFIDEVLELELNPNDMKSHSHSCNCKKCKTKKGKEDFFMDSIFGSIKSGYDDLTDSLKRFANCSIVDLTSEAKPLPKTERRSSTISKSKPSRKVEDIDSVVLHQMGINRGSNLRRYLKVRSHYIVMPDGSIGKLYKHTVNLNSSNGFNRRSIAIEFAGRFPSTRGRCWRSQTNCKKPTQAQIDAGRCLLAILKDQIPTVKYLYAHRQSSGPKSNDPGPDIWYGIGEWAFKNLGYDPNSRDTSIGSGRTIYHKWINWGVRN